MVSRDEEVYEKHADELVRFATVLVGASGAEDVVADAVVRVFSSSKWPAVVDARPYLFRAVLNEALSSRRSTQRRLLRELATAREETVMPALVRVELLEAMLRLTMRQRAVLFMTFWVDMPVGQLADYLEVSVRVVQRDLEAACRRMEVFLR